MAGKSKTSVLKDFSRLRGPFAAAGTSETELLSKALATSSQIERDTAQLRQPRDRISTESKDLAMIAQLKTSIEY